MHSVALEAISAIINKGPHLNTLEDIRADLITIHALTHFRK